MRFLSPAKLNLYLTVTGKKSTGLHGISSLFCPISLFDWIDLKFTKKKLVELVCNNVDIPRNKKNLVYKSIDFFLSKCRYLGLKLDFGIKIYIWKKIPIGSGFGGGSSNAASAIILLNRKLCFPFSNNSLVEIAKKVGSDVPFFVNNKPAIVSGIGDKFEYGRINLPKFAVIVYTCRKISTELIYSSFDAKNKIGLTNEIKKISTPVYGKYNLNDLECTVDDYCTIVYKVKKMFNYLDSVTELLSGSGSGVFGLYTDLFSANIAAGILSTFNRKWFVKVVSLLN